MNAAWSEPTASIPLRWGRYRPRYVCALVLLIAGGLVLQAGSAYAEYLLTLGFAAHVAGWIVLPSRGARRSAIAVPSALLVGSMLLGSAASVLLVGPLAGWLFLRQRPALSYLALALPAASGVILTRMYPQYGHGAIVVGVSATVVIAAAWVARGIASRPAPRR